MAYEVSAAAQPRRPIAAVAATTTWERFPGRWRGMLDEVWARLRQAGVKGGCNVMLYRDLPQAGHVAVEVGVEVSEEIDAAHQAVLRWCASQHCDITGERWEVYGDWHEDPAQLQTEVFYGLQESRPGDA